MIKISRIYAIALRHLIPSLRDPMRVVDTIYWPLIDIMLIGYLGVWAKGDGPQSAEFLLTLLICISCWWMTNRVCLEISRNLLIEIWDQHMINLFASPLSLLEFILALMGIGILHAIVTFIYIGIASYLVFSKNIFTMLPALTPFIPLFIVSGWTLGILTSSIVLRFGKTADMVVWVIPWFFTVISGIYSPISLFPPFLQKLSYLLPSSYLFEGIREMMLSNTIPTTHLVKATFFCFLYLILAFVVLYMGFNKSKKCGFKLE